MRGQKLCSEGDRQALVPSPAKLEPTHVDCYPLPGVRMGANDLDHTVGIGRLLQSQSELFIVKQLGDIGQGVQMLLELTLGNQEKHDKIDGLIVQGVKIDPLFGASKRSDDFLDQIGGGMGNANSEADARAHGRFALLDDRGDGLTVFSLDLAVGDEIVNQFVNRFPAV